MNKEFDEMFARKYLNNITELYVVYMRRKGFNNELYLQ